MRKNRFIIRTYVSRYIRAFAKKNGQLARSLLVYYCRLFCVNMIDNFHLLWSDIIYNKPLSPVQLSIHLPIWCKAKSRGKDTDTFRIWRSIVRLYIKPIINNIPINNNVLFTLKPKQALLLYL